MAATVWRARKERATLGRIHDVAWRAVVLERAKGRSDTRMKVVSGYLVVLQVVVLQVVVLPCMAILSLLFASRVDKRARDRRTRRRCESWGRCRSQADRKSYMCN